MKAAVLASLLMLQAQVEDPKLDEMVRGISGYNVRNEPKVVADEAFLKRVFKDLVDGAPTAEEIKAFVADADPRKRAAKINQLVSDVRFDEFWARRFTWVFFDDPEKFRIELDAAPWGAVVPGVKGFERWLQAQFQKDAPWTDIVSQMLTVRGKLDAVPEIAYVLSFNRGKGLAVEFPKGLSRHFLGIRLNCAECHDHPYDKWRVEDFYGMASFVTHQMARVYGDVPQVKYGDSVDAMMPSLTGSRDAEVKLSHGGRAQAQFLFGGEPAKDADRMQELARLMTDPRSTQLPRALANRVWGWLFGYGIVHPVDDFNLKNKALAPTLLEALVRDLKDHKYSLKRLVRLICNTNAYQMPLPEEAPNGASFRHSAALRAARGRYYPVNAKPPELPLPFEVPGAWARMREPSSAKALYVIRGKADASEIAELTLHLGRKDKVFLDPTLRQFIKPKRQTLNVEGKLKVTLSEVSGPNTCIQGASGVVDYTIQAAVVEIEESPYTFRFAGPTSVLNEWREEFLALLKGAGK